MSDSEQKFDNILNGYATFRKKYAQGDHSVMQYLSDYGQQPNIMVVACCDSRVDPALIFQCDPGDLFVVRNVANIVPPFEKDEKHHGTSAALEFGINFLGVRHLILLGHSQCGGIQALLDRHNNEDDFITNWVSQIKAYPHTNTDACAREALKQSFQNCLTFPWIQQKMQQGELEIHLWYFDIKTGQIFAWSKAEEKYTELSFHQWRE
jgi:carbonic anhydrase